MLGSGTSGLAAEEHSNLQGLCGLVLEGAAERGPGAPGGLGSIPGGAVPKEPGRVIGPFSLQGLVPAAFKLWPCLLTADRTPERP